MKKRLALLSTLCLLLVMTSCNKTSNFKISGHVSDAIDKVLYLEQLNLNGIHVLDSVKPLAMGSLHSSNPHPKPPNFTV